jgi:hypothetical protein
VDKREKAMAIARHAQARIPFSQADRAKWIRDLRREVAGDNDTSEQAKGKDFILSVLMELGLANLEDLDEIKRRRAADYLERGELPPEPLRSHAVAALRQPIPINEVWRDRQVRNRSIAQVIEAIVRGTGLKPTRNREKRNVDSACSIVAEIFGLTEPTVEKAWEEWAETAKTIEAVRAAIERQLERQKERILSSEK